MAPVYQARDGSLITVSGAEAVAKYDADPYYAPAPAQPYPNGDPDEEWTVEQMRAYASAEGISLSGQRTKLQILALLDPAHRIQPFGPEVIEDPAPEEPDPAPEA